MAALQPLIHTHPYTTSTWGVFDNLSIDVIMGLPKSSQGNTNIMVIIDTFSRYIELVPMKSLTSQAAVRALNNWMSRYGRPLNILTDNASQFMKEYQATLDALGIENAKTHPYSHQENGIVERANKEVMRHLRDIVYDTRIKDDWEDHLPTVQRIKNATRVSSTGLSPAELVFGNSYRLEAGVLYNHHPPSNTNMSMNEYISRQRRLQELALQAAYDHQEAVKDKHIRKNATSKITEFPINSYVLVKYENDSHSPPTKLHPILRGPFRVVAKHDRAEGAIYTCHNMTTGRLEDFHVKLLQEFNYEEGSNPESHALADSEAFDVEAILDHVFDNKKQIRSNMRVQVKWTGYENPTWEPYSHVSKLKLFHDYLISKNLIKFLPTSFKQTATINALSYKRRHSRRHQSRKRSRIDVKT
jgi:hypothetical protein